MKCLQREGQQGGSVGPFYHLDSAVPAARLPAAWLVTLLCRPLVGRFTPGPLVPPAMSRLCLLRQAWWSGTPSSLLPAASSRGGTARSTPCTGVRAAAGVCMPCRRPRSLRAPTFSCKAAPRCGPAPLRLLTSPPCFPTVPGGVCTVTFYPVRVVLFPALMPLFWRELTVGDSSATYGGAASVSLRAGRRRPHPPLPLAPACAPSPPAHLPAPTALALAAGPRRCRNRATPGGRLLQ